MKELKLKDLNLHLQNFLSLLHVDGLLNILKGYMDLWSPFLAVIRTSISSFSSHTARPYNVVDILLSSDMLSFEVNTINNYDNKNNNLLGSRKSDVFL